MNRREMDSGRSLTASTGSHEIWYEWWWQVWLRR